MVFLWVSKFQSDVQWALLLELDIHSVRSYFVVHYTFGLNVLQLDLPLHQEQ